MRILMVCLGNICRSPIAHGVMEQLIVENELPWFVDSAGTNGYHDGEAPDPRAIRCARENGIDIKRQVSRKIKNSDLDDFDLVLVMDKHNLNDVRNMATSAAQLEKIKLLMNYHPRDRDGIIPDPYYDNRFQLVFEMVAEACKGVVNRHASF